MDPLKAEVAKIKPTANNGYTVLVPINYKYLVIRISRIILSNPSNPPLSLSF